MVDFSMMGARSEITLALYIGVEINYTREVIVTATLVNGPWIQQSSLTFLIHCQGTSAPILVSISDILSH